MNLNQITMPAIDLPRSVAFYQGMGFELIVDSPAYARFESTQGDATFSLHQTEQASDGLTIIYFEHKSLDEWVSQLQARGYRFESEAADQRWLWREARLRDPANNQLCLFHAGSNRKFPPWRVDNSPAPTA